MAGRLDGWGNGYGNIIQAAYTRIPHYVDMEHPIRGFHWIRDTRTLGHDLSRTSVEPGALLRHDGPVQCCRLGLHASLLMVHALPHAYGGILCWTESWGNVDYDWLKYAANNRRVVAMLDANAALREFIPHLMDVIFASMDVDPRLRPQVDTYIEDVLAIANPMERPDVLIPNVGTTLSTIVGNFARSTLAEGIANAVIDAVCSIRFYARDRFYIDLENRLRPIVFRHAATFLEGHLPDYALTHHASVPRKTELKTSWPITLIDYP